MVDTDKLKDKLGGGSSKSKDKSKSGSSSSNSSSSSGSSAESSEPFSMDDETTVDPDGLEMPDTSKRWAKDHGELNVAANKNETLQNYIKRQVQETAEFYDNFVEIAGNNATDSNQFSVYYHALTYNMIQNRAGIMNVLQDRFNKKEKEALQLTKKICSEAGEEDAMVEVIDIVTEKMSDV